jgi:hypothetical protein
MTEDQQQIEKIFCDFLLRMSINMANDRIKQYLFMISDFPVETIKEVLRLYSRNNKDRQFVSPNDLLQLIIEYEKRIDGKSAPKTFKDIFGNKVRCETPLARELRNILKKLIYKEIDKNEAEKLVTEAEKKYEFVEDFVIPLRKTPQQTMHDYGIDENMIKRAFGKAHKGEDEKQELNELAKCLLPWGHYLLRATRDKLIFISLSDDDWRQDFQVLTDYAK